LSLRGMHVAIVYPEIHVNTAQAYSGISPKKPEVALENLIVETPIEKWKDVEKTVFEKFPEIKTLKEKMYACGAVYAAMSGSGSAVFGIFEKEFDLGKSFER